MTWRVHVCVSQEALGVALARRSSGGGAVYQVARGFGAIFFCYLFIAPP